MDPRVMDTTGESNFDDDDTHICLKCQNTIIGLENYVLHRRSKCTTISASTSKDIDRETVPSVAVVENAADAQLPSALDFFSSLELMSKTRLDEFDIDFDIPNLPKTSLELSAKTNNFLRITDLELESNFSIDIGDINKVRRGNFDSLADLSLMQEDGIIGIDRGRSILDSDIFSSASIEKLPPIPEEIPVQPAAKIPHPPFQSSGKWMPGKMSEHLKSGSTIHYFCRTCNRRLSSRTLYEKHLRSELHFKRKTENCIYEMEDEFLAPSARQKRGGRTVVESKAADSGKSANLKPCEKIPGPNKKYTYCEICSIKVPSLLFGKHLLSHYHYIKGCQNPQLSKELVLSNIDKVVKHFSFQCLLCHFYCNMMDDFLLHFSSDIHCKKNEKAEGKFCCQQCKFEESAAESIENHLRTEEHQQVVAALNQSVPIVIKKRSTPFKCNICESKFSLNIQLRFHMSKKHGITTAPLHTFCCKFCKFSCNKQRSLQRHVIGKHKKKGRRKQQLDSTGVFFCGLCDETFHSKDEAVFHRRKLQCREKRALANGFNTTQLCRICQGVFENLFEYKKHILELHPGALHRCQNCNMCFAISQDLSRHSRECKASFKSAPKGKSKFFCTSCQKSFTRIRNLVYHIRNIHQAETEIKKRTLQCHHCNFASLKKSRLLQHIIAIHLGHLRSRDWLCEICDRAFYQKAHLKLHRPIHFPKKLKCVSVGCSFEASHPSVLKRHNEKVHSKERDTSQRVHIKPVLLKPS